MVEDKTKIFTVSTFMHIEIPSVRECDKYSSQIAEIMKGIIQDFKPQGCKRKGMESFLVAETQSPLVSDRSAWEKADALVGVVASSEHVAVVLNRNKYSLLKDQVSKKTPMQLDLSESTISVILHNDGREARTYEVRGAFVNGEPIYQRQEISVKRRRKATIQVSNVGAASLTKHGHVVVLRFGKTG